MIKIVCNFETSPTRIRKYDRSSNYLGQGAYALVLLRALSWVSIARASRSGLAVAAKAFTIRLFAEQPDALETVVRVQN
jgi:hypothetical protein